MSDMFFERAEDAPTATVMTPVFSPNADAINSIPFGAELVMFYDGEATAGVFDEETRDDMLQHIEKHGPMTDHLLLYVDPAIIKDDHPSKEK